MDRHLIATRLAVRRAQVFIIEDRVISACEHAAGHGQRGRRPPVDRRAWDRHTWHRYLREAATQEHELGPTLRRLHGEIVVLERLSSVPAAA